MGSGSGRYVSKGMYIPETSVLRSHDRKPVLSFVVHSPFGGMSPGSGVMGSGGTKGSVMSTGSGRYVIKRL